LTLGFAADEGEHLGVCVLEGRVEGHGALSWRVSAADCRGRQDAIDPSPIRRRGALKVEVSVDDDRPSR
jgi:hypothetical protein